MAKRWVLGLGIIIASCLWAQSASARAVFTCTGGSLFIDVQLSDGSWVCYQTTTACAGEWSFDIARASILPSPGVRHPRSVPAKRAMDVLRIASTIRPSDTTITHRVSDTMQSSFQRRSKLQPQGTITISDQRLSPWTRVALSGKVPNGSRTQAKCGAGLYPNGNKCYPCLGCHPCGDSYCDNGNARLTTADLSTELARRGHKVVDGRIKPPRK